MDYSEQWEQRQIVRAAALAGPPPDSCPTCGKLLREGGGVGGHGRRRKEGHMSTHWSYYWTVDAVIECLPIGREAEVELKRIVPNAYDEPKNPCWFYGDDP